MTETTEDLWAPGATVWHENGNKGVIAKRYKNGNIVLEGRDNQQWRIWRDTARPTGDHHRFSFRRLRADTPQNRAEAIRTFKINRARSTLRQEAERLRQLACSQDQESQDAIILEAEQIRARAQEQE